MRNFFPLALLWAISHSCILAKLFRKTHQEFTEYICLGFFFPHGNTFLLQCSLEKKLTTKTTLTFWTAFPILTLLDSSGNQHQWGSVQNCK